MAGHAHLSFISCSRLAGAPPEDDKAKTYRVLSFCAVSRDTRVLKGFSCKEMKVITAAPLSFYATGLHACVRTCVRSCVSACFW